MKLSFSLTCLLLLNAVLYISSCSKEKKSIPVAPTGLTATVINPESVKLTWADNSSNEDGFRIQAKTGTGNFADIKTTPANTTSITITTAPNLAYSFRISSYNEGGQSAGNTITGTIYTITTAGTNFQGGTVGYILQPGDSGYDSLVVHGFIVAPQGGRAEWGCSTTTLGNTSFIFGTGPANTLNIVNGCSTQGIAARLCSDLVVNGYSDWFLPSFEELQKILVNATAIGGFENEVYWTSSEFDNIHVRAVNPADPMNGYSYWLKNTVHAFRAARYF